MKLRQATFLACQQGKVSPLQQDPPQSGSALADKVVTQPRGTDNDSTRV